MFPAPPLGFQASEVAGAEERASRDVPEGGREEGPAPRKGGSTGEEWSFFSLPAFTPLSLDLFN